MKKVVVFIVRFVSIHTILLIFSLTVKSPLLILREERQRYLKF